MSDERSGEATRRHLLTGTAAMVTGGVFGGGMAAGTKEAAAQAGAASAAPPELPWEWPTGIDPLEAGRWAYRNYFEGGCGHGAYSSLLGFLKEKVGYPWTSMPDRMMVHAAAGYAGHGTLCGSLGGVSLIIQMVVYKEGDRTFQQMIDGLYHWYANQEFPTDKFDDISQVPNQIRTTAATPLCHTSVTKWMHEAKASVTSQEKKERCAKVTGEVVYVTVQALNAYFSNQWSPPAMWTPSAEIQHCVACHSPDDTFHTTTSKDSQQGRMTCTLCHNDHTQ